MPTRARSSFHRIRSTENQVRGGLGACAGLVALEAAWSLNTRSDGPARCESNGKMPLLLLLRQTLCPCLEILEAPTRSCSSLEQRWEKLGVPAVRKVCEEPAEGSAPAWEKRARSAGLLWEGEGRAQADASSPLDGGVGWPLGIPLAFRSCRSHRTLNFGDPAGLLVSRPLG